MPNMNMKLCDHCNLTPAAAPASLTAQALIIINIDPGEEGRAQGDSGVLVRVVGEGPKQSRCRLSKLNSPSALNHALHPTPG